MGARAAAAGDFGSRGPRGRIVGGVVLGLIVAVILGVPVAIVWQEWAAIQALRRAWTIPGPPCPIVARLSPIATRRGKPAMTSVYGDAAFTRSFGAVSCAPIPEEGLFTRGNYHVCQFNNPGGVVVRVGGRATTFEAPVGRRLTITVRHGRASCVVGGWFRL